MKQMTYMQKGTLLALATACISGFSIFINKFAVTSISDPILFSGFKNAIVAVGLVGLLLAYNKQKEITTLTLPQKKKLLLVGVIGGSLPFALFFTGLSMIPAITAAMIHKTLFMWVALLALVFLGERFSVYQWLGVALLFASNTVIGGVMGFSGSWGELLVLAATLLWAIEIIIAKKLLAEVSASVVASARMVVGSTLLLGYLALTGKLAGLASLTLLGFGWTLLTAAFLLGYVLTWYSALHFVPASYGAALLVTATLITNTLSAIFITGALTETQVLSGFLALVGAALMIVFAKSAADTLTPRSLEPSAKLR